MRINREKYKNTVVRVILAIKKYKNNKRALLVFAFILFVFLYIIANLDGKKIIQKNITKREFFNDSVYCEKNEDCGLYECTNCGNVLWIEDSEKAAGKCNKKTSIIGCECENNACKRVRK